MKKKTSFTEILYRANNPVYPSINEEINKLLGESNWIKGAIKHPGALHRELHVPEGQKIPASKLAKAEHSNNPTLRKRANLAKTLKKIHEEIKNK